MSIEHQQVVIGYDFTETSKQALVRGLVLALRAPSHVLHVVCVLDKHREIPNIGPGPIDYRYAERVQAEIATDIETALALLACSGQVQFFVHARIGKPVEEILSVARDVGADLILVGTKGLVGLQHMMIGSTAERVVREAGCPVEVIRPKTYADVELLAMTEVEATGHYVRPHRYSYEDQRVTQRPNDWPLY